MTKLADITRLKQDLEKTEGKYVIEVKTAIRDALNRIFEDSSVDDVVFGVSTDPYNDENPGQGVYGPYVNMLSSQDDFERDDEYELFYNYGGPNHDSKAQALADILNAVGWKHVGEALGVSYYEGEGGQTSAFLCKREGNGYLMEEHVVGY